MAVDPWRLSSLTSPKICCYRSGPSSSSSTNSIGEFPLSTSAQPGHIDIVQSLLEAGADVNKTDNSMNTPLILALAHGQNAVAKLLINAGADVDTKNEDGEDVMWFASRTGNANLIRQIRRGGTKAKPRCLCGSQRALPVESARVALRR